LKKKYPNSNITVCDIQNANLKGVKYFEADLSDKKQIHAALEEVKPVYIVNLAGVFKTEDLLLSLQINVLLMVHICEYFKENLEKLDRIKGILTIGSAAQYGKLSNSTYPNEDSLCNPGNIYGWTKLLQEKLGLEYHRLYKIPLFFIRTANLIGPGMSEEFVVPLILNQVLKSMSNESTPIVRLKNINAGSDFIDVRDAVQAYITLLTNPDFKGRVYNIGNNKVTMLDEVILIIKDILDLKTIKIQGNQSKLPDIHALDCSAARKDLQWSPRITLEDTIRDMIVHLKIKK
jgi:nucleoside-diphosphate-sugar epimerase